MSDHYYVWAVVLVAPTGAMHIVASGIGKRHRAEKLAAVLCRCAPTGWTYDVRREAA